MDVDVVVVGAGPVGLLLAGELRLGGARVTVLEQLAAPTTESRASTLHARTMELLDQRGLLAALGTLPQERTGHFGGLPLVLNQPSTRYPGQWKAPQADVERALARWAAGLGAMIEREHLVHRLDPGPAGVRVEFTGPAGTGELTAAYVVGCDGEQSSVRRLAGFDFPGRAGGRELLRADVRGIDISARRFERFPGGLAIAARRPDGVTRVMVSEAGRAPTARRGVPAFGEVAGAWARVVGEDIRHGTPIWVNAFDDASRQVTSYRRGRVLLAGDAAHRQMPVGGQALNLGLQDAFNLGWKLAAVVTGRVRAALLDTYHDERHPVGRAVLNNIRAQAVLLLGGPETDAVRELLRGLIAEPVVTGRLAAMISGLDVRYPADGHPLAGGRLPHVPLRTPGGPTSTTALLRAGAGVLLHAGGDEARSRRLAEQAAGRVTFRQVTTAGAPFDEVDTILLRPDGHVVWAGDRTTDPGPALTRWFGQPGTSFPTRYAKQLEEGTACPTT